MAVEGTQSGRGRAAAQGGQAGRATSNRLGSEMGGTGAPYLLAVSAHEIHRLDFEHHVLRSALGAAQFAPVGGEGGAWRALDVGCGNGRWAAELAGAYPQAEVIGFDLPQMPVAPELAPLHNLRFAQGNLLDGAPFGEGGFAYTHLRLLHLAIPMASWAFVIEECRRVTAPEGWVEVVEGDAPRGGGPALAAFNGWLIDAGRARGIDVRVGAQVGEMLRAGGLRDLQIREIEVPFGAGSGRLGSTMGVNFLALVESARAAIIAEVGVTTQLYDQLIMELRAELQTMRCAQPYHVAWARR